MNPQIFGVAMDRLYAAGALEVFYVPIQMKKNRPGTLLTVVAPPALRPAIADIVFRETTTIGLRHYEVERECLRREIVTVETPVGAVRFKVAWRDGRIVNAAPEFEDCVRARRRGQPLGQGSPGAGRSQAFHSGRPTREPLLSHHRHRLRQQPAASRARLYEKVCADVIARYQRLCGVDDPFPDGERRALAERVQEGERGRAGSAGLLRPDGAGVPRAPGGGSTSRSTISSAPPSRGTRRASPALVAPDLRRRRHLRRASTKAGTASAAKSSSRRRISSTATARCTRRASPSGSRRRTTSSGCRSIQQPLLDHFAAHPEFMQPDMRRNEILRLIESGLDDCRVSRAGQSWGIPLPWRSGECRLRLVRRADQLLPRRVGLGQPIAALLRALVAGRSARDRQGHHPVHTPSSGRRC